MLTLASPSPAQSSLSKPSRPEIKRDSVGVSEKLRRHAGNVPVLPQTKLCPQCPAKFTRSTHLNRHLKTHSAERMHKCEQCSSEFTRTDLLSRHKKTCNGISRSRRKSCAPCAESKIKCDLAFPCDKCMSRGKECVASVPKKSRRVLPSSSSPSANGDSSPPDHIPRPPDRSGTSQAVSVHDWRSHYATSVSGVSESTRDDASGSVYTYNSSTTNGPQLSSMYSSNMFDPLFNGLFTPGNVPHQQPAAAGYSWLAPAQATSIPQPTNTLSMAPVPPMVQPHQQTYQAPLVSPKDHKGPQLGEVIFSFSEYGQTIPNQHPSPPYQQPSPPETSSQAMSSQHSAYPTYVSQPQHTQPPPQVQHQHQQHQHHPRAYAENVATQGYFASGPTHQELDEYMHLFWTQFTPQMPIMHAPTWIPEGKPDYLLAAMQACGALYVRSRRAGDFIISTLVHARRQLNIEFAKPPPDSQTQSWMFLSVALLQAVGMFHQKAETRASHLSFQAMLVQMIRRYGIVAQNSAWRQINHHDAASLRAAWYDWASHEVTKRAIMLSLVHDCCHLIYFGIPALFSSSEFDLNLPTDCDIWCASSPEAWFNVQHQPSSVYGWAELRVYGFPMQKALHALSDTRKLDALTARARINPLAHWVLIHTILRGVFALAPDVAHADRSGFYPEWSGGPGASIENETLRVQYVLHNWLESWLRTPESAEWRDGRELAFMCDALPFYWLGQVSLLALQEQVPPFLPSARLDHDGRFRLVKHWLRHVRGFLRRGAHEPTVLWNEMMKIRLQGLDAEGRVIEDEDGLLGFFDEKAASPF